MNLQESRGWWDHGRGRRSEWTCEGGANREIPSVVADGDRTRYQGGTYEVCDRSGRNAPTWVVPQDRSLVPIGIRLFLFIQIPEGVIFHETLHKTMAPMAWLKTFISHIQTNTCKEKRRFIL